MLFQIMMTLTVKDYTRVVSCNTTGLTRTLSTIDPIADIKKVRAVMVRRGSDPSRS